MRDIEGSEGTDFLLVHCQKLPARRKVIVHDVEDLAFHSFLDSRQGDRLSTVIYICKRDGIRSSQMEKNAESIHSDASMNPFLARPVNNSRANKDVRNAVS